MKNIYLVLLITTVLLSFQVSKAEERLKLSGKIQNIVIEDKKDSLHVFIKLKMSFKAVGNDSILLWKQTYPHDKNLRDKFLCVNSKILGFLAIAKEEKILYYQQCALPSIQRSAAWQEVKNEIDSKMLPSNQIQIIKSGEALDFDADWSFIFLKKKAINSNDPFWGYSSEYDVLSNEIKNAKDLSLQVTYRVWSSELESRSDIKHKKPFGKKLQKRWKKFGYLWLDDIVSEPISLDLNCATVINDEK